MKKRDGRSALLVGAIVLLFISVANVAYGIYRVTGGHPFELPLITGTVVSAGMAAVLFSRARAWPKD
jgi:hypothetical protein